MTTVGQLTIEMAANVARLQQDMAKAQSTVSGAMDKIKRAAGIAVTALGALGGALTVAAFSGFVRGAINTADEMSKLSQKIGVTVSDVAGLQLAFRQSGLEATTLQTSIAMLSRRVAEGNQAFDAMGVSVKNADGTLKSTRQLLGEVADRFSTYEDGVAKTALAMELFGRAGADLIPLLNGGSSALDEFDSKARKLGLTIDENTAKQAEKFNDTLDLMGQGFQGIGRQIAAEMLPTFSGLADQFFTTLTEGDRLKSVSDALSVGLKGLVAVALGVVGAFQAVGTVLGSVSRIVVSVFQGDFQAARDIAGQLKTDLSTGFKSTLDSMSKAWNATGSAAFEAMATTNKQLKEQAPLVKAATDAVEKKASVDKQALQQERERVRLLKEAEKAQRDFLRPYEQSAKTAQERLQQMRQEVEALELSEREQVSLTRAIEMTTIARLEERKAQAGGNQLAISAINQEIEARREIIKLLESKEIREAGDKLRQAEKSSWQDHYQEISQFAIQAARNVQTAFADFFFDPFDKGLKGLVTGFANAARRLVAEILSIKTAQTLGFGGMLGLGSGSAFASASAGGGGIGGIGSSLLNLGSSALSTGLGTTSLIGGGLSAIGGASTLGAFGAGLQGGSAGAAFIAAESATAGAGAAAGLGASMGAVAGPLIALAVVDQIGRLLAGDKSTGTFVDSIPVIGGFAGALFGRGPYKFREQQILGNVSAGGFEGEVSDIFRSKGGLLVGNKHKRQGVENEDALLELFDATIQGFADSTRAFADTLGLDADSIDDYTKKIFIRSEKGQRFTEEAINEFLTSIGDDFAGQLIPTIDELSLSGESAFNTLQRLSSEFELLRDAAVLFGDSAETASEKVKSLGLGGTTDFINQFGGAEKLSAEISEFYGTVFTESQKLDVVRNRILNVLQPFGIDFIPTLDQLYEAVKTGNPDLINAALQIDGLVSDFNALSDATDGAILNERISLENRLLQLQGDTSEIRQRELDALDESNRTLLERIFSLEDEQEALAKNEAILSERASLQRTILQLEGNTAAIRKLELDALDPSNRALQERIFLLQDEQKIASESKSQMQSSIKDAFGVLQTAVNVELKTVSDKFKWLISNVDNAIKSTSSSISKLTSISDALKSSSEQIRGVSASDARGNLQRAILQASKGNIVDLDSVRSSLSAIGNLSTSGFSTREEFARQTASDAGLVDKLNSAVIDQLSVEEQTLNTLEEQKLQLQEQFDIEQQTLNKVLSKAQEEIDATFAVDKSLNILLGKKSPFVASISSIALSVSQLVRDYKDAFESKGFASGGTHLGGLRIVGERGPELEMTGPSRIISNNELASMIGNQSRGDVNLDLGGLERSINKMNDLLERVVEYTRDTSDTLSRVSDDGVSLRTTAA